MGNNMGLTWGRQDPGGPHVGLMNLAVWVTMEKIEQSASATIYRQLALLSNER